MYKQIKKCLQGNNLLPLRGKILGVSGIEGFRTLADEKAEVIDAKYPQVDLQCLPFDSFSFDYVISDQVLEHLLDPKKAIEESYRVLRENGVAIHTTCFINYIHRNPIDLWRFSPEALRHLCKPFSKILSFGGWGNRAAILACFASERLRQLDIPDSTWSPQNIVATYNEERYPIVVWVVARK